jgi:hypothetical protein
MRLMKKINKKIIKITTKMSKLLRIILQKKINNIKKIKKNK